MPLKPGLEQHVVRTLASFPTTAESAAAEAHTSSAKRNGEKKGHFRRLYLYYYEYCCTYHDEVVEQLLFEVLGNLLKVVGDKVMIAVDRDTRRQLQRYM